MKAGRKIRYSMAFLGLIILMAVLLAWNICAGSVNISVKEVTEVLFGEKTAQTASRIVWEIRLPGRWQQQSLVGHWRWQGICFRHFSIIR